MTPSLIDAKSLLLIEVGSVTTRAMLFDVVQGRYRFLARGLARTTAGAPFHDVSEGVRRAIDELQQITGRVLVDAGEQLILPSSSDGSGVDAVAACLSAGAPLKTVLVGLLEDVSVESAQRLASTLYCDLVGTISLNDRRKTEERIDAIVRNQPDVILMTGGTENGASQSVLKLLEAVGLACFLLPEKQRPSILFAGNSSLQDEVQESLGGLSDLYIADNVRPALENEQLDVALPQVNDIFRKVRSRQLPGVEELSNLTGGGLLPAASAFGRVIRFLSQALSSKKGVLGVDVGASATTLATSFGDEHSLSVYPQFGLGQSLSRLLMYTDLGSITRWLPLDLPDEEVRNYLYNKALYPDTLPATVEDLAIEQALVRQVLRLAVEQSISAFPSRLPQTGRNLLPWFEPVMVTGSALTEAPTRGQCMMMLLDGLQPTGITTLVLDQNQVIAGLGAAAAINPILAVQVLDSNASHYLGTVISPVGSARPNTPVLQVRMTYENGQETNLEVKQGALEVLPLPLGQTARLRLQPLHRYDVGMGGPGRSGDVRVHGSVLGVIIDARGRPLQLPSEPERRREMLRKWLWTLGG